MIKLSPRLERIADYVTDDEKIVDVGCDHGLLDVYLAQKNESCEIIASDVSNGALDSARKNISKYHLGDRITPILSSGLDNIDTDNVDAIVIAGMGAHTIVGILYTNMKKLKRVKKLVVQSNNDLDFLRAKVTKLGYYISNEELVKDAGIIYTIVEFRRGFRFYRKRDLYFGPCLMKENSPLFREKQSEELKKMEQFYPKIPKNHRHHRRKIATRIRMLKQVLNG